MGSFSVKDMKIWSKVSKECTRGDEKSLLIVVNRSWRGLGLLSKYKAGKHNLNCKLVLAQAQIGPDCPTAWDEAW